MNSDQRAGTSGVMSLVPGVKASATLSPCGTYRYLLSRDWYPKPDGLRHVLWIMLNPSVADGDVDDRTVRKCQKYARRWGFNGISVCNLFALRSLDPKELYRHPEPVGEANDVMIDTMATAKGTGLVVVAWGQHGALRNRGLIVLERLLEQGAHPMRIGPPTKGGHPWHPLYRPDEMDLEAAA